MRTIFGAVLAAVLVAAAVSAVAQPPGGDKGKKDKKDKGGPGGFMPPRPGELLPPFLGDMLRLTDAQKKELDALQKDVDGKLDKILTDEQKKMLKDFGPGGFPPPKKDKDSPPPKKDGLLDRKPGDAIGPPADLGRIRTKPREVAYSPAAVRTAVEKSLPMLWTAANGHSESRSCFTCHNHGVPMVAFATARDRGFDVPADKFSDLIAFIVDDLERNRDRFLRGQGPGPSPEGGETDNTGYMLFALDVAGYKPDRITSPVVDYTLGMDKQREYWGGQARRPPSEYTPITTTALCLNGIRRFGRPEHQEAAAKRTEAARGWLLKAETKDTEERVFRLIGLKAGGASEEEIRKAAKELADTQRADGGWGQTDAMDSDAYATGSALYALHTAGGLPTDDAVYRRGLAFLLGSQQDDGTWYVRSRSNPFQKYFETGFPYGRDQFISCAASSWATAALALDSPKK